ncbi:uncharacterized protein LOC122672387 [Telopea speciosissima]|uniref:uncharacterized protein LOC122672387 n=1 Tax=Telopea speciosissima TaxID=54955 RepID=UPI001CC75433|nr:uncharacterized protein LOC122672387 [Telopea speciosissima]
MTWLSLFGDCSQVVLTSNVSDHAPLLVVSDSIPRLPNAPFRLQRLWLEHHNFLSVVEGSWKERLCSSPPYILAQKLKRLKPTLRAWAKENYPNLEVQLSSTKNALEAVQVEIDCSGMTDQLFEHEVEAKKAHAMATKHFEKLWAEKSRVKRKLLGDRCSKFFHLSTKLRRARNTIRTLIKEDGNILVDQDQIKQYVEEYFENFHKAVEVTKHEELLNCIPRVLEDIDIFRLDSVPGDSEIRAAVWDLDPDSAPGLNDFPGAFFRACWEVVGSDVCNAARYFFFSGRIPLGINNCFLALIPKTEGATSFNKFRPLCMGNFFYKMLSKVMARRLELVLPRLISQEQGAFQKGKFIQDNISLASELANMLSSATRGGGLGLKIDIQKAYDTILWAFIFKVLKFGFSERGLTSLLNGRKILPLRGPRGVQTPGHCLFADDIFIFTNASLRRQAILEELQISVCRFTTRYLGVEIAKGYVKKNMLPPVLDRVRHKLAGWKGKLLSMAGRVELVKTMVSSMPIHSFSVYWWPPPCSPP